jgi:transcription elongation factor Elf1
VTCPHCDNDDPTLQEHLTATTMRCDVCSKQFQFVLSRHERLQLAADAGHDTWDDYRGDR